MDTFSPAQLGLYTSHQARLRKFNLAASPLEVLKGTHPQTVSKASKALIQPIIKDTTEFSTATPQKDSPRWKQILRPFLSGKKHKKGNQALQPKRWTRLLKPLKRKDKENLSSNP